MHRDESRRKQRDRGRRACRAIVTDLRRYLRRLKANHTSPLYVDGDDPSQQAVLIAGARASSIVIQALCQESKYHNGTTCACARAPYGSRQ